MISFLFNGSVTGSYTFLIVCLVTAIFWKVFFSSYNVPIKENITANENVPVKAKKIVKDKNCGSGIGGKAICSKKVKLGSKAIRLFVSSAVSNVSKIIEDALNENGFACIVMDLNNNFDCEDLIHFKEDGNIFLLSEDLKENDKFYKWLKNAACDPKYGKLYLSDFKFVVYNTGSGNFEIAQDCDQLLWKLGGQRLKKVNFISNDISFEEWRQELVLTLNGQCKKKCGCGPKKKKENGEESSSCSSSDGEDGAPAIIDVEDLLK